MTTPSSDLTPPLSKKPFLIADGVILLVALFIAWTGAPSFGIAELLGVAACIALGVVITLYPFVIDYTRREESAFAVRKAQVLALSEKTAAALEKLHALSLERAAPSAEPPAWLAEFQTLRTRLDTLEPTLAASADAGRADLRQLLDTHLAATSGQLASAAQDHAATLSAVAAQHTATHALVTTHQETTRRSLDELAATLRLELAASADRHLARADAQWQTTLASTVATAHAGLRQLLDAHLASATGQLASAAQDHAATLAASAAQHASTHALVTAHQETTRHSLDEHAAATRLALTASADSLLARFDEHWRSALATLEHRLDTALREHIAAELAEEKASALRRSVAATPLVLEPTAPSAKSRLGRGLESLITSPQAKPGPAEPAALPASPEPSAPPAPISPEPSTPAPAAEIPPITAIPSAPVAAPAEPAPVTIEPVATPPPAPAPSVATPAPAPVPSTRPAPTPAHAVLDPFHIPTNGYADLASAMDAELG